MIGTAVVFPAFLRFFCTCTPCQDTSRKQYRRQKQSCSSRHCFQDGLLIYNLFFPAFYIFSVSHFYLSHDSRFFVQQFIYTDVRFYICSFRNFAFLYLRCHLIIRISSGALLFGIKVTGNCSAFKIIHFRGCVFAHFHLISARSEIRTASF